MQCIKMLTPSVVIPETTTILCQLFLHLKKAKTNCFFVSFKIVVARNSRITYMASIAFRVIFLSDSITVAFWEDHFSEPSLPYTAGDILLAKPSSEPIYVPGQEPPRAPLCCEVKSQHLSLTFEALRILGCTSSSHSPSSLPLLSCPPLHRQSRYFLHVPCIFLTHPSLSSFWG